MVRYKGFDIDDVIGIHTGVLIRSNEMKMDGVLNEGSLQVAVEIQERRVYGKTIYRGPAAKIGALMYELITLHPFIEGNKRTGFMCADILLILNNYILVASDKERSDVSLKVARLEMSREELIDWLRKHAFKMGKVRTNIGLFVPTINHLKENIDGHLESLKDYKSHLDDEI